MTKKAKSTRKAPPPRGQNTRMGKRARSLLEQMRPYLAELVPESTACALIGLDHGEWLKQQERYPALKLEAKRIAAARLVELQREAMAGGPGWQARMTMLERRDPQNFQRGYTPASKTGGNPMQALIQAARKKSK